MTPSSATGLEAAGVPFNSDGTIHMQDLGYWFGCPPGMKIDKFLEHVRKKYRASISDGEGAVAWPTRRANVPYHGSETTRLVGFVIEKGDEAFGEYGLSEPLAWLDRMCAAHPAPVAAQPAEGWKDDPSADERWNAGLDFAMDQLCILLGVHPKSVVWDAATETVDGDVRSVMGNIMRAKYGEDWGPNAASPTPPTAPDSAVKLAVEAVEGLANGFLPGGPEDMKGAFRHIVTAIRALATNPEPKT